MGKSDNNRILDCIRGDVRRLLNILWDHGRLASSANEAAQPRLTSVIGRKLLFNLGGLSASERPVSVRANIRPGWMSAFRPKAAVRLKWVGTTATDPLRPFAIKQEIA